MLSKPSLRQTHKEIVLYFNKYYILLKCYLLYFLWSRYYFSALYCNIENIKKIKYTVSYFFENTHTLFQLRGPISVVNMMLSGISHKTISSLLI